MWPSGWFGKGQLSREKKTKLGISKMTLSHVSCIAAPFHLSKMFTHPLVNCDEAGSVLRRVVNSVLVEESRKEFCGKVLSASERGVKTSYNEKGLFGPCGLSICENSSFLSTINMTLHVAQPVLHSSLPRTWGRWAVGVANRCRKALWGLTCIYATCNLRFSFC